MVRATCTPAFAVNAIKAGDYIVLLHALDKGADTLSIAMAAAGVPDTAHNIPFQFNIYLT